MIIGNTKNFQRRCSA